MRLWLLMNRRYPPYSKWLGTAFSRVPGTDALGDLRYPRAVIDAEAQPLSDRNCWS